MTNSPKNPTKTDSTKIITTIGPSTLTPEILSFFSEHSVQIARLNFSHGTVDSHRSAAQMVRKHGLELLFDLSGPKLRLGDLSGDTMIQSGETLILELQRAELTYPYSFKLEGHLVTVLPCVFDIAQFAQIGNDIVVDDGKLQLQVVQNDSERVYCNVKFGGLFKTRKSLNLPHSNVVLPFMGERDKDMLTNLLVEFKPEYVAPSFVKNKREIVELKAFITELLDSKDVRGYFPKLCTKLEMADSVSDENLASIVEASDMIMIARGDLALETLPLHIAVPFYQEKIKRMCRVFDKPFVVATQILESMISAPVPTRAEVSDLYRAVILDNANFIMLSAESAAGSFPIQAVELMHNMISQKNELKKLTAIDTIKLKTSGVNQILRRVSGVFGSSR